MFQHLCHPEWILSHPVSCGMDIAAPSWEKRRPHRKPIHSLVTTIYITCTIKAITTSEYFGSSIGEKLVSKRFSFYSSTYGRTKQRNSMRKKKRNCIGTEIAAMCLCEDPNDKVGKKLLHYRPGQAQRVLAS